MSWEAGVQNINNPFGNINDQLEKISGVISDSEAKVLMYKFFRENVGIFTEKMMGVKLFPFQEWFIKGVMLADYSMFIGSRGSGKCVKGDTLIQLSEGLYRMDEVIDPNSPVNIPIDVAQSAYGENGFKEIEYGWNNGWSKTKKVVTDCGYEIENTLEHRIRVVENGEIVWKESKNLKVGDYVVICKDKLRFGKNKEISCEDAWNLGFEESNDLSCIPCEIRMSTPNIVWSFISGFCDKKGDLSENGFCVTNLPEGLSKELQSCLLFLGVVSSREKLESGQKDKKQLFSIKINDFSNFSLFLQKVVFKNPEHLKRINEGLFGKLFRAKNYLPDELIACHIADLYSYAKENSLSADKNTFGFLDVNQNEIHHYSYERLNYVVKKTEMFCDTKPWKEIKKIASKKYFYDRVKTLEDSECQTFDIHIPNDHSFVSNGFISHNTFINALLIACLLTMYPGIKIGVVSASFRQAQLNFKKLEDILESDGSELLKECLSIKNKRFVTRGNTSWEIKVKAPNNSEALAVPLTEKIRGYRFNVLIVDEMLLVPENIFEGTIMPTMTNVNNVHERKDIGDIENELIKKGKMKEEERIKWPNNKLILTSSASYSFEYLASLYEKYKSYILNGTSNVSEDDESKGVNYFILHMSYEALPTELYDPGFIQNSINTMSESNFRREMMSEFLDDSSGFFKFKDMLNCSYSPGEGGYSVEIKGEEGAKYFIAFDTNLGSSETNDHFAIHVFRLDFERKNSILVHSRALAGASLKDHTNYMNYLMTNFNIIGGIGDAAGGGERFIQSCNESSEFKESKISINTIYSKNFPVYNEYDNMNKMYVQFQKDIILAPGINFLLRVPDANWNAHANDLLQASFCHRKIWFASPPFNDAERENQMRKEIVGIEKLIFIQGEKGKSQSEFEQKMDLLENQSIMINMTKQECAMIVPRANANGSRYFDLPPNIKRESGKNRARKDSYAALVLGNWFSHLYFNSLDYKKTDGLEDFMPILC